MSRLCWVFVLLAVACQSDGRDSRPMDCQEWQVAGYFTSGVYTVWLGGNPVRVQCDMDTDGGGWTVIQRRGNFSPQQTFNWFWKDYKNGIGQVERDFWLGNDNIFALSNQGNYSLRMDMTALNNHSAYTLYDVFRIEDEKANYKLDVRGHSGTAGDSMALSDDASFSTRDRGDTKKCAETMKGGFWYTDAYSPSWNCSRCNPNGLYKPGVDDVTSMHYFDFMGHEGLLTLDMKLKRL